MSRFASKTLSPVIASPLATSPEPSVPPPPVPEVSAGFEPKEDKSLTN